MARSYDVYLSLEELGINGMFQHHHPPLNHVTSTGQNRYICRTGCIFEKKSPVRYLVQVFFEIDHTIGLNRQICWDVSQQGLHEPSWSYLIHNCNQIFLYLQIYAPWKYSVSQYAGRWCVKRNERTFGVLKYLWEQACSII